MSKHGMTALVLGVIGVLACVPMVTVAAGLMNDTSTVPSYSSQVDFVVAEATAG